jgi:hypothetical protein
VAGGFERNTRNKFAPLPVLSYPTGGGLTQTELPKTGFLSRIYLSIAITVGGTVNTPNPAGIASAIKRVRVYTNGGIDLYNVSGIGNGYLLQNAMELEGINGRQPKNQYNTAVSATSFNLDMVVPIMINLHDPVGLLLLQNEQLQVILSVEWETPTNIGGSTATVTAGTCTPVLEFFTVPVDKDDYPPLNVVHQIIEDQIAVGITGDFIYNFPRGNVYLQALLGYGIKATAVDNWSKLILRINQNDILYTYTPGLMDQEVGYQKNLTRGLGSIPLDFLAKDGLGAYGSARDFINSALLTDFQAVLTTTATDTLYVIRRMLVPLGQ